jgi:alkanesulfonate monooxygenase SsuD/methylene tetrahydromethanopterin reductase-like flavin-dependent oxidoreductase (luciferase family)
VTVKVGVLLDREPGAIGAWLADAAAFDAGGADALWVDCGAEPELDVLALAAALAMVTHRARLVVASAEQAPARTVDTIGRLSHGRFVLGGDAEVEGWLAVPVPDGREAWRRTLEEAAEQGVPGVVVPADSRLLDILRNPEDPGERHDLQLAQG